MGFRGRPAFYARQVVDARLDKSLYRKFREAQRVLGYERRPDALADAILALLRRTPVAACDPEAGMYSRGWFLDRYYINDWTTLGEVANDHIRFRITRTSAENLMRWGRAWNRLMWDGECLGGIPERNMRYALRAGIRLLGVEYPHDEPDDFVLRVYKMYTPMDAKAVRLHKIGRLQWAP